MAAGPPGGIFELLDFVEEHWTAIAFDLRDRFKISIEAVTSGELLFGESIALVEGLMAEQGTRTHAAVAGWAWPMTRAEHFAQMQLAAFLNVHRDRDKHPAPMSFPVPWPDPDAVTPAEREALVAELERRSVFRDR